MELYLKLVNSLKPFRKLFIRGYQMKCGAPKNVLQKQENVIHKHLCSVTGINFSPLYKTNIGFMRFSCQNIHGRTLSRIVQRPIQCFYIERSRFHTSIHLQTKKNYYKILGVKHNSTGKQIKDAYFRLSKKYHPERNKNDPTAVKKFQEVSEAYAVLGDERSRDRYDASRGISRSRRRVPTRRPPSAVQGSSSSFNPLATAVTAVAASEIFRRAMGPNESRDDSGESGQNFDADSAETAGLRDDADDDTGGDNYEMGDDHAEYGDDGGSDGFGDGGFDDFEDGET